MVSNVLSLLCSVCFNISDSEITFTMASLGLTLSDRINGQPGQVTCLAYKETCIFMCNSSNSFEFNDSRTCTHASWSPDGVAITIDPCKYAESQADPLTQRGPVRDSYPSPSARPPTNLTICVHIKSDFSLTWQITIAPPIHATATPSCG